ncbi:general secretion pathway protein, partial [Escherichia coli]|nr:general secretion pathway protein [Escherichia coli]
MKIGTLFKAALIGVAVATATLSGAAAETLRVMEGGTNSQLNVPMNRAVVIESDVVFSELSIANPSIADISTLSDRTIY